MVIQVAGPVCEICDKAVSRVEQAIAKHGLNAVVERVTDFDEIVALTVYTVPGILIDGLLKSVGRIPDHHEVVHWLAGDDT